MRSRSPEHRSSPALWKLAATASFLAACTPASAERAAPDHPARRDAPTDSAPALEHEPDTDSRSATPNDPFGVENVPLPESSSGGGAFGDAFVADYRNKRREHPDLDTQALFAMLKVERPKDSSLPFDVESAKYFTRVAENFLLTPEELTLLKRQGVVGIDHDQNYSMGSAYHAIYTRDLPVLVTTDSILHALHRSYSNMLKNLERGWFSMALTQALEHTHEQLARAAAAAGTPPPHLKDVDLYLTVGRNLLEGAGDPEQPAAVELAVHSKLGADKAVRRLLGQVRGLQLQHPSGPSTAIYGGQRHIDFSQFKPRGHYAGDPELRRYFQTLMWMGRADLGWNFNKPQQVLNLPADPQREFKAAASFVLLLELAGQREQLQAMSALIDFFVGASDDVSIAGLQAALTRQGIDSLAKLDDPSLVEAAMAAVLNDPDNAQTILSQNLASDPDSPQAVKPPIVFQTFGQRFVLDSFAMSQVVFDSIAYRRAKPGRQMPRGLDVMAVLGSDRAMLHLKPELDEWHYGTNLLALRQATERIPETQWTSNLYQGWLGTLRLLAQPSKSPHFPQAMRGAAWADKQLQTQSASWAELRHDTLLYAKQSYTAGTLCEYPEGYVEPYPKFFEQLARLAATGKTRLETFASATQQRLDALLAPNAEKPDPKQLNMLRAGRWMLGQQAGFFENFAKHMVKLQTLAAKELAAKPFTQAEGDYLRKTIDVRMQASGGPTYSGWYPRLIYGGDPDDWDPVVADVHTAPDTGAALEVATGNVSFIAVAVDNKQHHAIYVGPIYSYYEFQSPVGNRLTDEQWQQQLATGTPPARPSWTRSFQPPALKRSLKIPKDSPLGRMREMMKRNH